MKILALGAFTVPYIRDNWGESLKNIYNDDVYLCNLYPGLACYGVEYAKQYVYRLIKEYTFDYMFFYHDWVYHDFDDEFFDVFRAKSMKISTFYPDDEPETWYQNNKRFDHHYDLIASQSSNGLARRVKEGNGDNVIYLPWGFNSRACDYHGTTNKTFDVVFIGKNKVDINDPSTFREDGQNRQDALVLLAELCDSLKWKFGLFGYGWEKHPSLSKYAQGTLTYDQMVQVYNNTKIVYNPAWSNDNGLDNPQTKLRHFEVAGCGAFQITNYNEELAELFEQDKEIVFYRDNNELSEIVTKYIKNDRKRDEIAKASYRRAHGEHTLDHRVTQLFNEMRKRWPIVNETNTHKFKVKQICLTTESDLSDFFKKYSVNPSQYSHYDALHFIGGNFEVERIDYSAVSQEFNNNKPDAVGIRSFFNYKSIAENEIQPLREELKGDFLNESFLWNDLREFNKKPIQDSFLLIDAQHATIPMVNYLVRPDAVLGFIEAFLNKSYDSIKSLKINNTGVLVNELLLPLPSTFDSNSFDRAPEYIIQMQKLFPKLVNTGKKLVVYGARGEMAERALDKILQEKGIQLSGIIDNGAVGKTKGDLTISSHKDLDTLNPDYVFIAAASSGAAIYKTLNSFQGRAYIMPLYDLKHPIWKVLHP